MVGIYTSFLLGPGQFSGAMLVVGSVFTCTILDAPWDGNIYQPPFPLEGGNLFFAFHAGKYSTVEDVDLSLVTPTCPTGG